MLDRLRGGDQRLTQPAMGRLILEAPVPKHDAPQLRRIAGCPAAAPRRSDLQSEPLRRSARRTLPSPKQRDRLFRAGPPDRVSRSDAATNGWFGARARQAATIGAASTTAASLFADQRSPQSPWRRIMGCAEHSDTRGRSGACPAECDCLDQICWRPLPHHKHVGGGRPRSPAGAELRNQPRIGGRCA